MRPVLGGMKDSDHHDGLLEWLVENQIVAKLRDDEPADLRVTRRGLADSSPKFAMLGEQVGGVENGSADALRCFWIVGGDVTAALSSKS